MAPAQDNTVSIWPSLPEAGPGDWGCLAMCCGPNEYTIIKMCLFYSPLSISKSSFNAIPWFLGDGDEEAIAKRGFLNYPLKVT